jgi:hypothetical protein
MPGDFMEIDHHSDKKYQHYCSEQELNAFLYLNANCSYANIKKWKKYTYFPLICCIINDITGI